MIFSVCQSGSVHWSDCHIEAANATLVSEWRENLAQIIVQKISAAYSQVAQSPVVQGCDYGNRLIEVAEKCLAINQPSNQSAGQADWNI